MPCCTATLVTAMCTLAVPQSPYGAQPALQPDAQLAKLVKDSQTILLGKNAIGQSGWEAQASSTRAASRCSTKSMTTATPACLTLAR
ncbi:MAG: hypothetical protein ACI89X_004471 [Planctomycetota bacterium]|jgi:hypothetical protein